MKLCCHRILSTWRHLRMNRNSAEGSKYWQYAEDSGFLIWVHGPSGLILVLMQSRTCRRNCGTRNRSLQDTAFVESAAAARDAFLTLAKRTWNLRNNLRAGHSKQCPSAEMPSQTVGVAVSEATVQTSASQDSDLVPPCFHAQSGTVTARQR